MFRPIAICLLIFSLCTTPVLAADKKPALEEAPPIPITQPELIAIKQNTSTCAFVIFSNSPAIYPPKLK